MLNQKDEEVSTDEKGGCFFFLQKKLMQIVTIGV